MKLMNKLFYFWLIAILVIVLPDSIKGFVLIVAIIVWISNFFISDEEKEKRRQAVLRREKDNENAERVRMIKERGYREEESSKTISFIYEPLKKQEQFKIIMADERTDTVKDYDEYLHEFASNDKWNTQKYYDEYVEELRGENVEQDSVADQYQVSESHVGNIEDPYEDYNLSVGISDGYSEDDNRSADPIEDEIEENNEKTLQDTRKSSLDLGDESRNEHWAMYDEDIRTELDPAHELKQKEYRQDLRNYRGLDTNFHVGDSVEHHKFWKGIILSIKKDVGKIKFQDWETKTINLTVAPIKKEWDLNRLYRYR